MVAGEPWGEVELEPEVRTWYEGLPLAQAEAANLQIDRLEARGPLLGEPYTRQLRGKLRELRFFLGGQATRITYFIATGRRIILLTVFPKAARREQSEIERAYRTMLRCIAAGHEPEDIV